MFAIIRTGGKQYKVAEHDIIAVERLNAEPGAEITLQEVLMIGGADGVTVGAPLVDGATVAAEVVDQTRGPKLIVFKKKRRKNYRRKNGHRQDLTVLRITGIAAGLETDVAAADTAVAVPATKAPAADVAPVETAPVETAPVETAPAEAAPADNGTDADRTDDTTGDKTTV
jgi:large subunit ribosomal protein L21